MASALLFLLAFEWYLIHIVPGSYFGDCGEILSALFTQGVPHPTGFPLYLLLAAPFVAFGKTPFWVHVLSAGSAALAVLLMVVVIRRLLGDPVAALVAGLLLVSSSTLLVHSAVARVYPLNLALLLGFAVLVVRAEPTRRQTLMLGFLTGLGMGTHLIFMAGPLFGIVLHWRRRHEWVRRWPWFLIGSALPLSVYLLLPLFAHRDPPVNWGDPSRWTAFVDYLTQRGYQKKMFARDWANTLLYARTILHAFARDWPVTHWLLAFTGVWFMRRKNPVLLRALLTWVAFNLVLMGVYGYEKDLIIAYRYFLPTYAAAAILGAFGWKGLMDRFTARGWLGPSAIAVIVVLSFLHAYPWRNLSRSLDGHDYAADTLKPIEKGVVVQLTGDNQVFPVAYVRFVQGMRPDLRFIEWEGTLFPEAARALKKDPGLTRARIEEELFNRYGKIMYLPEERSVVPALVCEQVGLCYRMTTVERRRHLSPPPDLRSFFRLRSASPRPPDEEGEEIWAHLPLARARDAYTRGNREEALARLQETCRDGADIPYALVNAAALYSNMGEDVLSEKTLKRVLVLQPNHLEAHLNLGILYGKMGRYPEALVEIQRALSLDPANPIARYYLTRVQGLIRSPMTTSPPSPSEAGHPNGRPE